MYSRIQLAIKYLSYYFSASNGKGHGTHSPFVFDFIIHVLNDSLVYSEYERVEERRVAMLADKRILPITDFGAGSSNKTSNLRSVSSIASTAVKSKKFGQLLFRMVKQYQPSTILELGTSLGITSSYMALGNPQAKMITMEGASEIAAIAKANFRELGLNSIELVQGDFQETLPGVLSSFSTIDFVFVDGNHRKDGAEKLSS